MRIAAIGRYADNITKNVNLALRHCKRASDETGVVTALRIIEKLSAQLDPANRPHQGGYYNPFQTLRSYTIKAGTYQYYYYHNQYGKYAEKAAELKRLGVPFTVETTTQYVITLDES